MGSRVCKSLLGDRRARGERAHERALSDARPCGAGSAECSQSGFTLYRKGELFGDPCNFGSDLVTSKQLAESFPTVPHSPSNSAHAVLASEDHLLVCQTYESHSGGTDNLRLHMLNPLAAAAPGAATYSASCGAAHRACVCPRSASTTGCHGCHSTVAGRPRIPPRWRCAASTSSCSVAGADREEVEVRSLGSGEVVRRIDVSCRACPDRPVEYRQWFAHDMALGWTQEVTQGAMQGEAPHGMEPASDREVYVLTSYAQRSAILAFGADGSPRSRRLLPFRASANELLLPDSAAEPGAVLDLRVSCIAAHRRADPTQSGILSKAPLALRCAACMRWRVHARLAG